MTEIVEFVDEVGEIYGRSVRIPCKGTIIPQHVHSEPHTSICCKGKARLYVNDLFKQDVLEGHMVLLEADKKHSFESLEDDTLLTCLWTKDQAARLKERGF